MHQRSTTHHPPSVSAMSSSIRLPIALVHFQLVSYSLLWWTVQPVFPYLSSSLGASATQLGYIAAASQCVQLLGSPVMGRVMDKHGPRVALLLSHAMGGLSYLLLSFASSLPLLYLSQLPTFFLAAMHASQTYCTLVSTADERAAALGSLSLSYGIGMVLGPTLGGLMGNWLSYQQMALVSAVGSLVVLTILVAFLPPLTASSAPSATSSTAAVKATGESTSLLSALSTLVRSSELRSLLLTKVLGMFAISLYRQAFTILAKDTYSLSSQQFGYLLSAVAVLSILANTAVIRVLSGRLEQRAIIRHGLLVLALSFLSLSLFTSSLAALLAFTVPITIVGSLLATQLTASLTSASSANQAGAVLGLDQSVGQASRVAAPVVAGWLLDATGKSGGQMGIGLLCGAVVGLAWLDRSVRGGSSGTELTTKAVLIDGAEPLLGGDGAGAGAINSVAVKKAR